MCIYRKILSIFMIFSVIFSFDGKALNNTKYNNIVISSYLILSPSDIQRLYHNTVPSNSIIFGRCAISDGSQYDDVIYCGDFSCPKDLISDEKISLYRDYKQIFVDDMKDMTALKIKVGHFKRYEIIRNQYLYIDGEKIQYIASCIMDLKNFLYRCDYRITDFTIDISHNLEGYSKSGPKLISFDIDSNDRNNLNIKPFLLDFSRSFILSYFSKCGKIA